MGSGAKWASFFNDQERQSVTLKHVKSKLQRARKNLVHYQIQQCKVQLEHLSETYKNPEARKMLGEIDLFYKNYKTYYQDLIASALKKNFIFTAAGYYKRLQKLFPNDPEAKKFFRLNRTEIEKRYETNKWVVKKYLRNEQYNSAIRVYRRILNFDPDNSQAQSGLKQTRELKQQKQLEEKRQRILARKKKEMERKRQVRLKRQLALKKKKSSVKADVIKADSLSLSDLDSIENQTSRQAEVLYVKAVQAYRDKRFIDAKNHFESLSDQNYKDTRLYLERIEDKIQALGLEGGDEE